MSDYQYPAPGQEPFNAPESEMEKAWSNLRPIETRFHGFRFRSRLEARWAVFFDHLKISYQYEPEGFDLPNGQRYLPDFWLSDVRFWAEVKPFGLSGKDRSKVTWLALSSQRPVLLLVGPPNFMPYAAIVPDGPEGVLPPDHCLTTYSLDVVAHSRQFIGDHRLYFQPCEEELEEENCSVAYREAVRASRAARFDEAA